MIFISPIQNTFSPPLFECPVSNTKVFPDIFILGSVHDDAVPKVLDSAVSDPIAVIVDPSE